MSETKRHGDPRFYQLLEEIAELHSRKNHDYARQEEPLSNFNRARSLGIEPWKGVLVRMTDKWSRIEELSKGKTPKNESLRDSLVDNAVYSLIAVLLLEEHDKQGSGGCPAATSYIAPGNTNALGAVFCLNCGDHHDRNATCSRGKK